MTVNQEEQSVLDELMSEYGRTESMVTQMQDRALALSNLIPRVRAAFESSGTSVAISMKARVQSILDELEQMAPTPVPAVPEEPESDPKPAAEVAFEEATALPAPTGFRPAEETSRPLPRPSA